MDAPQSKRFKQMRRDNGAVSAEAVRESMAARRLGLLKRIFRFGGKRYEVTAVKTTTVAPVPAKK